MNMNQVVKNRFSWRLAGLTVVMIFLSTAKPATSQSNRSSTLMRYYCSQFYGMNDTYFYQNLLNTTFSTLRRQLLVTHYAVARTLLNGESVWGLATCRGYVSTPNCVACFDYAVAQLRVCGRGNGAHAFYNDCDVRYENNNFYPDAYIRSGIIICGNTTSPQQSNFRKSVEGLTSDLRKAAPRTPSFYAASTREIPDSNATVYAIAQCNLNLTQTVCEDCLNSRYTSLYDCLPSTNGRAIDNGCFMRYSSTPFFALNQATDITPFLWDDNSKKKKAIIGGVVGGVCFLLIVIAFFLWRLGSKKRSGGQRETELAEERTEDHGTTFSQLRRSNRVAGIAADKGKAKA